MKTKRQISFYKIKMVIVIILLILTLGIFGLILFYKLKNPFQVSIYNYESYLSKKIINDIKKKYSYHVFGEINEFTKAINTNKAVAGVGSDHQIAQLILEGKIKKLNLSKVYGKNISKEEIFKLYPKILQEHLNKYEQWIYNKIKEINPKNEIVYKRNSKILQKPYLYYDKDNKDKIIGFEADSREGIDHFYEYLIPYFMQDKVIAYNINSKYRPHLKNIESIKESLKGKEDWLSIIKTLVEKHNYRRVYWTNSFLDNSMIGQFYATETKKHNYMPDGKTLENLNFNNYKEIFKYFFELVKQSTGHSIKDEQYNKLVTSGLELVNDVIEPTSTKADVSIMYNGDALDSFYANDNFAKLQGQQIDYVRPKNNYMLLDAWIVSSSTDDDASDRLLEYLNKVAIFGSTLNQSQLENKYINSVYNDLVKANNNKKEEYAKNLFEDSERKIVKKIEDIDKNFYKENYETFMNNFDFVPSISNFNAVNYTPGFAETNKFLKRYYFKDEDKKDNEKAISIFDIEGATNVIRQIYQPINLKLRTEISDYYFENTKS
ncbi:hypothetical protein [Metamycoplasma buccale]|uniref:hypothetical protein n=1 Tax=Metamycoplasma buccale TaxID=55602 RepID=UPI00398F775C